MPEFHLDTSGAVTGATAWNSTEGQNARSRELMQGRPHGETLWSDLDGFTQGYIEALFFTAPDEPAEFATYESRYDCSEGHTWTSENAGDSDYMECPDCGRRSYPKSGSRIVHAVGFSDLAPETLAAIIADCRKFQADHEALLTLAYERSYDDTQAGRDLWFTSNGHGVGYWDREVLEPEGEEWDATEIPLDQWTPELRTTREALKAASPGQLLTLAAEGFSSRDAYLGDDGKVYLS